MYTKHIKYTDKRGKKAAALEVELQIIAARHGLAPAVISSSYLEDECIICMENITEPCAPTTCCGKTLYHSHCGQEWFDNIFLHPTCPWCKTPTNEYQNDVGLRSYNKLKHVIHTGECSSKDEKGYFEIIHCQENNKKVFHILFKNKVHLVYWFSQKIGIFSYNTYKNVLSNQKLGLEKYRGNDLIAELYFD
jgi:hypothetical protein